MAGLRGRARGVDPAVVTGEHTRQTAVLRVPLGTVLRVPLGKAEVVIQVVRVLQPTTSQASATTIALVIKATSKITAVATGERPRSQA